MSKSGRHNKKQQFVLFRQYVQYSKRTLHLLTGALITGDLDVYLTYYPFSPDMSQVVHPIIRSPIEISLINWSGCQEVITHLRRRKRSINLIWLNKKVKFLPCHLLSVILGSWIIGSSSDVCGNCRSPRLCLCNDNPSYFFILYKLLKRKKGRNEAIQQSKSTAKWQNRGQTNVLWIVWCIPSLILVMTTHLLLCWRTIRINKLFVD